MIEALRTLDLGPVVPSDGDLCAVVYVQRGEVRVSQAGYEAALRTRDFALCDLRTFGVRTDGREAAAAVLARVPRGVLPLAARRSDRLLVPPWSGQEGLGALFAQFLDGMTEDPSSYRPADIARLGAVGLDLLVAVLDRHLDRSGGRSPLPSIEGFIREHLRDPDLSPRTVAAAHHISVSYLHRLFQATGTTVAALIRDRRLEGARRDLTDPRLRETPVHQIAARWGFKGHAAFTRAFRATYEITPRGYRHQVFDSAT